MNQGKKVDAFDEKKRSKKSCASVPLQVHLHEIFMFSFFSLIKHIQAK
jgi:hypothetical protein